MATPLPIVLTLSGHDPSGGAGIQADIETLGELGCVPCSVITALTEQDSRNVKKLIPQRPSDVADQARTVLTDMPVAVVKIGLIGSTAIALELHALLTEHPHIPVVLDPILAAGGGSPLGDSDLPAAIGTCLVPRATVITPNSPEARTLASAHDQSLDACAVSLLNAGCPYVLITGTHEDTDRVINRLYHCGRLLRAFSWPRLPHSYHGSGCTLASAIAAKLARGLEPPAAIEEAQQFTWNTLAAGIRPGRGQHFPDRFLGNRS